MKNIIGFLILMLFSYYGEAQIAKFQSMFIYNFAQNVEWPTSYKNGDFIIGVVGNSPVSEELDIIAKSYKVGNQKIRIQRFKSPDKIENCHILFLPKSRSSDIGLVISSLKNFKTLLITEKEGFANAGAIINFVIKDGQLKFELNSENAQKNGLEVNSYLKKLAI